MIWKYLILILLVLPSLSFGMKQIIEPMQEEQEYVLEQLRKEQSSYLSTLPRELINELQHFIGIRQAIESSKDLKEAIKKLKVLADPKIHARYFKDLKSLEPIIYALAIKFKVAPNEIAEALKKESVEGAERWLKEVWPQQLQLLEAVREGNMNAIKQLIAQHVNPNIRGVYLNTPLIKATLGSSLEAAQYLLEHGANVNAQNMYGTTALMEAALQGNLEIVRLLLEHGADVNAQSSEGWTALINAALYNHTDIVKLLLEHGANPNIKNKFGTTALRKAQDNHNEEMIEILQDAMVKQQQSKS